MAEPKPTLEAREGDAGMAGGAAASIPARAELQVHRVWRFDEEGGAVEFDNDFSGARLNACERVAPGVYRIVSSPENLPINPSPWYAFRVAGEAARRIEVRIAITSGRSRPWPHVSRAGGPFERVDEADYAGEAGAPECVLRLEVGPGPTVVASNHLVGIAEIDAWSRATAAALGVGIREIGRSAGGRPIRAFEFGDGDAGASVVVIGRQHPPEASGTVGLMRFVEALAGDGALAREFRATHRVLCVPLVNPDGVHEGQWRSTLGAVDANRDWGPFTQVETRVVRDAIDGFVARTGARPRLLLDFHATARDLMYLPPEGAEIEPPRFGERWLAAIEERIPGEPLERSASHNATEWTFKRWAVETYRAPGITFEFGASTPHGRIARLAEVAACEAMRLLLESVPAPTSEPEPAGAR